MMQHNTPPFSDPRHFVHPRNRRGKQQFARWQCTVCTDADVIMTTDDALLHETSQKHISNIPPPDPVVLSDWDTPQNAVDGWLDPPPEADDKQFFICRMTGFIPFWVRGVEAAAEGDYLRLEDYLNDVEKANLIAWEASRRDIIGHQQRSSDFHLENWSQNSNNGWGKNNNGWGNDGWKVDDQGWGNIKGDDLPSAHWSAWPPNVQDTLPELASDSDCSGHVLVERVAKSRAASPEKAQRLRSFFDMPTAAKVKEIDLLINELRPFFV